MKDIINDLRSFSREETTNLEQHAVKQLVEEALYFLKHEISSEVNVDVEIPDELQVLTHSGYIGQILTNLIKNASDALMENGKDNKAIIISGKCLEEKTIINVRDNGPGIPADTLNKIFDPFFTTKPVGEGAGLGLSITHKLMDAMNGSIECKSVVGEHTEFILTFSNRS